MSILSYDEMVEGLVHQGVPRQLAESTARQHATVGLPAPEPTKDDRILEKQEQAAIVTRFRACGCKVFNLSQARAAKQTPGLADLYVQHLAAGLAWWWESKRQVDGVFSLAQLEFRDGCGQTHERYGSGDRYAAESYLIALGLATRGPGGTLEPTYRSRPVLTTSEIP